MTYEQALNKAAAYCSKAERAPRDVASKLRDWDVDEESVDKVLDWLTKENFLSEERFAHAFVNDKYHFERWGRIKIGYALRQKGIEGSLVQNTLDDVIDPESYLQTAVDLLRTKLRGASGKALDAKTRAAVYRFAAQRGFEADICRKALQELQIADDNDE